MAVEQQDANVDSLVSQERFISESPVMWPEHSYCMLANEKSRALHLLYVVSDIEQQDSPPWLKDVEKEDTKMLTGIHTHIICILYFDYVL